MAFVLELQNTVANILQTVSLGALLAVIEPLVLLALAPFALPYLFFQWCLSKRRYQEEYRRTPQMALDELFCFSSDRPSFLGRSEVTQSQPMSAKEISGADDTVSRPGHADLPPQFHLQEAVPT